MKFKKKKKGSMGYFYSLSPGDPKLNAEIFNHNMGSNSTTSNSEACSESLLEEDENFEKIKPKDYWYLFGIIQNATNQGIPIVLKNKNEIDTIYTSNKNSNRVLYRNEWVDRDDIVDIILKSTNKGSDLLINWNDDNIYVDSSTGKLIKNESLNEAQKKNEYLITYIDRDTDSVTRSFVDAYSTKQAALVF